MGTIEPILGEHVTAVHDQLSAVTVSLTTQVAWASQTVYQTKTMAGKASKRASTTQQETSKLCSDVEDTLRKNISST